MLGMPGMRYVPLDAHHALGQWEFSPFPVLVLVTVVVTGAWYLRARSNLVARGRPWSWRRTTSFLSGLVLLDLALQSPVAMFTMEFFQAHVIQHLLLMVIAPPLLAMGAPMTLALQTSGRPTKVRLLGILNSRAFRLMTHPLPVAFAYYFSMFAFFLTSALGYAMFHMWVMDLVNVAFLFASTLFWWPIVGLDPIPHWKMGQGAKLVSLLLGVPIESFLALALLSTTRPVASIYTLGSTHAGAGLLWVGAELFTFLAIIPVFVQWVRMEERKAARYDAQLDAELAASQAGSPAVAE
jgi:putative copper resistance protein D